MCIHLPFKYKKATQALNFFAIKSGGEINKMKALKLVFFADRYHIRKYARPITNCEYKAMDFGPVASEAKDIAEFTDFASKIAIDYAQEFIEKIDRYTIKSKANIVEKVFSKSDLEALRFAWDAFGALGEFALSELTHKYPEWNLHEEELKYQPSVQMDYEDFFKDPSPEFITCFDLSAEEKQARISCLKEVSRIEKAWSH